ncbi:Uncharacterised protein [Vibrio cholerae]|nr:Uncharacterised protein [Vibrio cholerae]
MPRLQPPHQQPCVLFRARLVSSLLVHLLWLIDTSATLHFRCIWRLAIGFALRPVFVRKPHHRCKGY